MRLKHFLLGLLLATGQAVAENFDATVKLGDQSLNKCSESKLEKYFYDLGRVALYREDCESDAALTDSPVYVEFAYTRAFEGEDFAESARKLIKRNISEQAFNNIQNDLETFNSAYESIKDGDHYAIAYSKATGLTLFLNDEQLASNDNQELAQHYFTIWFGDKPFSDKLKKNLLEM